MPTFSIPLSGLTASSSALSTIANNLANLNTVGYKEQQSSFRDLFYQTLNVTGSGDPVQVGAGAELGINSSVFSNGNIDSTGVPTDVAITGDGFFVTQKAGVTQFTRAGNFSLNNAGQLATQDGALVMGYPAVNGMVTGGPQLSPISLGKGLISPPTATTSVQLQANLNAAAGPSDAPMSQPMTIYDSLGTAHVLSFQFTKTGPNAWNYQLTLPAADVAGATAPVVVSSGALSFDSNGKLTSPATNVAGATVNNLANGASPLNVTWQLFDANGNSTITQTDAQSATSSTYQNGSSAGTLLNFNVGNDGVIQGTFTNNRTMALGQIALAGFANTQGLERIGGNNYRSTFASGSPVVGAPGMGGRGTLQGGSLEASNVDIAQEFTRMITTQRGYQANARVVTTFDQVMQDTVNLVR